MPSSVAPNSLVIYNNPRLLVLFFPPHHLRLCINKLCNFSYCIFAWRRFCFVSCSLLVSLLFYGDCGFRLPFRVHSDFEIISQYRLFSWLYKSGITRLFYGEWVLFTFSCEFWLWNLIYQVTDYSHYYIISGITIVLWWLVSGFRVPFRVNSDFEIHYIHQYRCYHSQAR